MNNLGFAIRALLRILRDRGYADAVRALDEAPPATPAPAPPSPAPSRDHALALLSLLQREGRLIDFLQEPIDSYSDAQVGAAVRDIHKSGAGVLDQVFGLEALHDEAEGSEVTVAAGFEAAAYRLSGNLVGEPPYRGVLRHHGWRATRCELPTWTGSAQAATVVAPAEVELP